MKITRKIIAVLLLGSLIFGLVGCSQDEEETATEQQTTTARIGSLSVDITAAGNLALSQTEDLVADLFYQEGTVSEVLVETGDSVSEGDVLVSIDADEWQDELDDLEDSLSSAQRAVETQERSIATAERLVTTRELAVAAAKRQVSTKEIAYETANITYEAAKLALYTIDEVAEVQEDIDYVESQIEYCSIQMDYAADAATRDNWLQNKEAMEDKLESLETELAEILAGTNVSISDTVALEIQRKQLAVQTAQISLEAASDDVIEANLAVIEAESNLEEANTDLEYARTDLENAQKTVEDITESLAEAQAKSPEVTAPFDGFIVSVNVEGGDEITRGTVVVQIADPDKFEVDISVGETDILDVEIGTTATVEVDAISSISFPAEVTAISPTASISSGVVNYTVTVTLSDMEELAAQMQENMQAMHDSMSSDNVTGSFTPPDGMEMPEGFSANMTMPEGFSGNMTMPSGGFGQGMSTMLTDTDYDLRDGMSVTVSLIIATETNALLVPYTAVSTAGGVSYVEVVLDSGETEQREVTTGTTDYSYIVIESGLEEGETIVVPEGTVTGTVSSMSMQFGGGGAMMIPGMGGGR